MCIQPVTNCLATIYCDSLLLNRHTTQINRLQLQLVLCCAACAITRTPKFHLITHTPILKSLYWQPMNQRFQHKVFVSRTTVLKLVTHLVFAPISHSKINVLFVLHLLSHVIALLSLLVSKFQTDHSINSLLPFGMVLTLTYFMLLITPLLLQLLLALASLTFPPLTF